MSEKSWDFFAPINFETKFPLFTFTSTYLIFVLLFVAILYMLWLSERKLCIMESSRLHFENANSEIHYRVSLFRYINLMFWRYGLFFALYVCCIKVLCFGGFLKALFFCVITEVL